MEHIDETDRRIVRISEEFSARTKILATDIFSHIDPTDNEIEAARNQVTEVKVQMCEGKSKANISPRKDHEGPKGEKRYSSTLSLTSALDRVGGQRHAPASVTLRKTRCLFLGGW